MGKSTIPDFDEYENIVRFE